MATKPFFRRVNARAATPPAQVARPSPSAISAVQGPTADPKTGVLMSQLLKRTQVPAFIVSDGLIINNLPADAASESGLFGVASIMEEATPAGALTTSLAGVGQVVLDGVGDEIIFPGVVLEFSTNASTSQPSAISGRLRGRYKAPTRYSAATGDLRARGAAFENLTFDTGVFTVTPLELGSKYTMVILGHQVVNSRTFLRTLTVAGALVSYVEATPLVLDISTAPTGLVTTMTVLTPTHYLYPQVIDALTSKDFA